MSNIDNTSANTITLSVYAEVLYLFIRKNILTYYFNNHFVYCFNI